MKGSDYFYGLLGVGIVGAIAYAVYKIEKGFSGSPLPEVVRTAQDINKVLSSPFVIMEKVTTAWNTQGPEAAFEQRVVKAAQDFWFNSWATFNNLVGI